MKSILKSVPAFVVLASLAAPALAEDLVFEGPWRTTNRKLDGIMTSVVTETAPEQWKGRFYGIWQGVKFDYTVTFTGPESDLRGTASIDGAHYDWKGSLDRKSPGRFQGSFTGSRYTGSFDLQEKRSAKAAPVTPN